MECYTSLLRISSVYQIPLCGEGILSMTSGTPPLQIPLNKGKGKIIIAYITSELRGSCARTSGGRVFIKKSLHVKSVYQ